MMALRGLLHAFAFRTFATTEKQFTQLDKKVLVTNYPLLAIIHNLVRSLTLDAPLESVQSHFSDGFSKTAASGTAAWRVLTTS